MQLPEVTTYKIILSLFTLISQIQLQYGPKGAIQCSLHLNGFETLICLGFKGRYCGPFESGESCQHVNFNCWQLFLCWVVFLLYSWTLFWCLYWSVQSCLTSLYKFQEFALKNCFFLLFQDPKHTYQCFHMRDLWYCFWDEFLKLKVFV